MDQSNGSRVKWFSPPLKPPCFIPFVDITPPSSFPVFFPFAFLFTAVRLKVAPEHVLTGPLFFFNSVVSLLIYLGYFARIFSVSPLPPFFLILGGEARKF